MSALLAKTKLTPEAMGDAGTMRGLLQRMDAEGDGLHVQSHYTVAGSYQERVEKVNAAFRLWYREDDNYDYRYSSILAIDENEITFYTDSYYNGGIKYYVIPYAIDASGTVTLDKATINEADATIIVTKLAETTVVQSDAIPAEAVVGETVIDPAKDVVAPIPAVADATPTVPIATTPVIEPVVAEPVAVIEPVVETPVVAEPVAAVVAQAEVETEIDRLLQSADPKLLLQSRADDGVTGESYAKIVQAQTETINGKPHMVLDVIATRGDIENSQGQVYPTRVWAKQVARLNEQARAGKMTGKLEHQGDSGLETVAIVWQADSFRMEGNDLRAKAVVIQAGAGLTLEGFVNAGGNSDFSTVGYGSSKPEKWQGRDVQMIQDDFVCTRIDAVKFGSSFGSTTVGVSTETIPAPQTQSDPDPTAPLAQSEPISPTASIDTDPTTPETQMSQSTTTITPTPEERMQAQALKANLVQARTNMLTEARDSLDAKGVEMYEQALTEATDAASLMQAHDDWFPKLERNFPKADAPTGQTQGVTRAPSIWIQHDKAETAPKNTDELLDRLVQHLPTSYESGGQKDAEAAKEGLVEQSHMVSPRAACRRLLQSIAGKGKGRTELNALLALEQGRTDYAENMLSQSLATGSTTASGNVNPGGAPLSAPMIFSLVSRVFPQLIAGEIASIQPMDRPAGKIFFKDALRVYDGTNANDKRIDINTSAQPFDPNFSNNNTEGSFPALVRIRLSSIDVTAVEKKLAAQWTIEESQDLEAYHGLDAQAELVTAISEEIAIEKNMLVLNGMLAAATGTPYTYGTVAPAGWTQKDWNEEISTYINFMLIDLMTARHNPATHLVMGPKAYAFLSRIVKWTVSPLAQDMNNVPMIAGATYNQMVTLTNGVSLRIIVTSLWTGANSYKMLAIRRGPTWSETPYVWSPYKEYTTPPFINPADFSTMQGYMTRDAYTAVIPDSMAVLTVAPGQTGVALT